MSKFDFSGSNVKEVSVKNFDQKGNLLNTDGRSVILFYATWCGHCQHVKPTFIELSKSVKNAKFMAFDMSEPTEEMRSIMSQWKFKIEGFPTIIGFYNGQPYSYYKGDRTAKDLMTYISGISKNWNTQ
jgi:thiol-disulfide isomerase/thioredoxin